MARVLMGRHSTCRRALAAGLATFCLTLALFSTPLLASFQEFNHIHSEGSPLHFHPVSILLPFQNVTVGEVVIVSLTLAFGCLPLPSRLQRQDVFVADNLARAPPA